MARFGAIILGVCLLAPVFAEFPTYSDSIARAMWLMFEDKFDSAETLLNRISQNHPEDPTPAVFAAVVRSAYLQDREDTLGIDSLLASLPELERECIHAWGENPRDPWANFVMGTLYGQWAVLEFFSGGIFGGVSKVMKAEKLWKSAAVDSTLAPEVYNGLGNLYYWRSAKAGVLGKVGIIGDRREEGIRLLRISASRAKLARDSALHSLFFVLLDFGDTAGAESVLTALGKRHPRSRTVAWDKLVLALAEEKWDTVLSLARSLREYYDTISALNVCQLGLAQTYALAQMGDTAAACEVFRECTSKTGGVPERVKKRDWWKQFESVAKICRKDFAR